MSARLDHDPDELPGMYGSWREMLRGAAVLLLAGLAGVSLAWGAADLIHRFIGMWWP